MSGVLAVAAFLAGVVIVVWSTELLLNSMVGLAALLRAAPFVIAEIFSGLEAENVAVGLVAGHAHHADIALGTVFGGGSFIVCVALGLGTVLFPLRVRVPLGVLMVFAATPMLAGVALIGDAIVRGAGGIDIQVWEIFRRSRVQGQNAWVTKVLHRIGWIGLVLIAAFLLFAVGNDVRADHSTGIPVDHAGAFTAIAGQSFDAVRQAIPGVARYITTMEVGYALHELTFVVLFVALVLIPLRRRQAWAWWTCWAIMIANLGYTFTIARHDSTIMTRSLIADVAVPLFLLLCAPAVFGRRNTARATGAGGSSRPDYQDRAGGVVGDPVGGTA